MLTMTCRNHPTSRYLTKEYGTRHLFFVEADLAYMEQVDPAAVALARSRGASDDQIRAGGSFYGRTFECPCSLEDLVILSGTDLDGNEVDAEAL